MKITANSNIPPHKHGGASNAKDSLQETKKMMDEELRRKVEELKNDLNRDLPLTDSQIKQAKRTQGDFPK